MKDLYGINIHMKELYIPFEIPNLELVQKELLEAIEHDYKVAVKPHAFVYVESYMQEKCPTFMSWLKPKLKQPVRIYRYYVTPPYQKLPIHIDGASITVPFGLNIPVTGCKNTMHTYYKTPKSNLSYVGGAGYLARCEPKDYTKLEKVVDLEIDRPYVTNNEEFHSVTNDTDGYRIMFTVRWAVHPTKFRTVYDVMDTTELMLGVGYTNEQVILS
jgi:hypothetical protein